LPEGARANARQRLEAARQIPLWLVAKACTQQKDAANLAAVADKLTHRSIEAARRQNDKTTLLAIQRERGALALDRGARAAARAAWEQMLDLVIEPVRPLRKNAGPQQAQPGKAARPQPRRVPPVEKGRTGPISRGSSQRSAAPLRKISL